MEKKMSKKAIYAEYGIEFKDGKINAPVFGWINPLLINGNAKLGKGVYTFSTLPTNQIFTVEINGMSFDVKGTCPCHCNGCYATKGFYNMPSVIISNAIKTILCRDYLDFVKRAIIAQIKADGVKLCRIHASGDFFSLEYITMWKEIAIVCGECVFWSYTKNTQAENAFDDVSNVNIVKSLIHGYGFNFGHCDYILKVYRALVSMGKSVYICRCGVDKNQHCTNCKGCSKNDYVLFIEHSTEYKAEEDPCFAELKEIIEKQPKI